VGEPIGLLLLGAGHSRNHHVPAVAKLAAAFEVRGVFSRTEAHAAAAAAALPGRVTVLTDLDRALAMDGIEAVDVALPIVLAATTVEAAFARGWHVFSEKPVADSVARGHELMQRHAQRPELVWFVAEDFRYWPTAIRVRELIAAGEIGTPLLCNYPTFVPVKGTPFFESDWRRRPEYEGGFLMDGGVHDIAALRLMFGEVAEVSAVTRSVDPALPPADTLVATLTFESGLVASYSASYALDPLRISKRRAVGALARGEVRAIRDRYGRKHVLGTRGSLLFMRDRVELVRGLRRTRVKVPRTDVMTQQFEDFHAGVRDGRPVRNTPAEGLRDLEVIEALLASARERAPMRPGATPAPDRPSSG